MLRKVEIADGKKVEILGKAKATDCEPGIAEPLLHTQADPVAEWTVNHALGYRPTAFQAYDTYGQLMVGIYVHINSTSFIYDLGVPVSGTLYFK